DFGMVAVVAKERVNEGRDFVRATQTEQTCCMAMKQLSETFSVPRRSGVGYTLCCGQSLSEIALFEETLGQPKFRQRPIRCQFGTTLKSAGREAGVAVGKECAACAEEKGGFVNRAEIAEEVAPIIAAAENVCVLFLDGGRVQPRFFAALP